MSKQKDNCPHCNQLLKGEDIYENFRKSSHYNNKTDAELLKLVEESYGYTKENPKHFYLTISLEYPELYDGALINMCPSCKGTWGRFSNKLNISPIEELHFKRSIK